MKLVGGDKWTMWYGQDDEILQSAVRKQYNLTEKMIPQFQLLLNNRRPMDPRSTMKENKVVDASTIIILPRLKGGSQMEQTSLLSHGFKRKRTRCKTSTKWRGHQ